MQEWIAEDLFCFSSSRMLNPRHLNGTRAILLMRCVMFARICSQNCKGFGLAIIENFSIGLPKLISKSLNHVADESEVSM